VAIDTSKLTPAEMLRYLMQGRAMSASDLGRLLGERSLGAAVLRGDRELSKAHIRTLSGHFRVSPAVFIRP
jgi:antitoxin component HigA of HigAB toxin-antitoxin module